MRAIGFLAVVMATAAGAQEAPGDRPGLAERVGLATSFRAGAWTHDRDLNDETLTAVGGVRARLAPRAGALDAFAEGYVQADSVDGTDADLVEGWLRWTHGPLAVKAGRQIVVWGRADRLNPSDVLSSRDYTLLVASDDEQRRGSLMVQGRLGLGAFTLDGYWLPEFRDNRFPLDRNPAGAIVVADQRVEDRGQFALKLDRSGGSVDWSLGWFHGTDRTRDFVRVAVPAGSPAGAFTGVQQQFPRVDVLAADVAGTWGRIGWRAEAAWSRYRGADTIFRKNDNLWLVAGFDTDVAGWNLNLQYSVRRIFDHSDPRDLANPIDRAVASQSAAVNNQLDRTQHGVTARVARKWLQDTLDFELASIVYLNTGDAAIRPKLTYAINDRLRLTVAADIFVGPRLSYFGRVRELSAGFLQLTCGF
ncbi:MAG: hypothetical protein DCF31_08110 [Alphaproteobacteria bacterium]|nr:MAG: hypothetical protein DCF31_08110 [Alphaproteobacteria bacterium]